MNDPASAVTEFHGISFHFDIGMIVTKFLNFDYY
jgi:hypothetical protein